MLNELNVRFRDIRQGPGGYIYVLTEGRMLLQLVQFCHLVHTYVSTFLEDSGSELNCSPFFLSPESQHLLRRCPSVGSAATAKRVVTDLKKLSYLIVYLIRDVSLSSVSYRKVDQKKLFSALIIDSFDDSRLRSTLSVLAGCDIEVQQGLLRSLILQPRLSTRRIIMEILLVATIPLILYHLMYVKSLSKGS